MKISRICSCLVMLLMTVIGCANFSAQAAGLTKEAKEIKKFWDANTKGKFIDNLYAPYVIAADGEQVTVGLNISTQTYCGFDPNDAAQVDLIKRVIKSVQSKFTSKATKYTASNVEVKYIAYANASNIVLFSFTVKGDDWGLPAIYPVFFPGTHTTEQIEVE